MNASPKIGRLMMIDDDAVDHKLCQRLIARSGLVDEFVGFLSAEEALAHLGDAANPAVDVILLDVNMPRMNGFEFLDTAIQQLGEGFAQVVVVMLTTSLDPKDEERARSFSIVREFCHKPLLLKHLEKIHAMMFGSGD